MHSQIKNKYEVGRIINSKKPTSESKILDIGCGKGFMIYDLIKLIPGIQIKGIDISKYAIDNYHSGFVDISNKIFNFNISSLSAEVGWR